MDLVQDCGLNTHAFQCPFTLTVKELGLCNRGDKGYHFIKLGSKLGSDKRFDGYEKAELASMAVGARSQETTH